MYSTDEVVLFTLENPWKNSRSERVSGFSQYGEELKVLQEINKKTPATRDPATGVI
tara:strand:+ start:36598 stop:36765 length:168 start_codon:yes stop_codon:yes gene_type:complete